MKVEFQALTFTVHEKRFFGRRFGAGNKHKVLAIHGWLDNSASFDLLAPWLTDVDMVAVDLAGHGRSDFRSTDAAYNIWQDVGELIDILKQLHWDKVTLLGHSRGASIATLITAAFPERVSGLVLLDNFLPQPVDPANVGPQLRQAIVDKQANLERHVKRYSSWNEALNARMTGRLPLNQAAVEALAGQGVVKDGEMYLWRYDPRLFGASEVKLTQDHIDGIILSLQCPVILLLGRDSKVMHRRELLRQSSLNPNVQVRLASGGHHFHMEGQVDQTATLINDFLVNELPAAICQTSDGK